MCTTQDLSKNKESCEEHALKMNIPKVIIHKPFLGDVTGAKYNYFLSLKIIGKLDLF